jgi:hypothetical protein
VAIGVGVVLEVGRLKSGTAKPWREAPTRAAALGMGVGGGLTPHCHGGSGGKTPRNFSKLQKLAG